MNFTALFALTTTVLLSNRGTPTSEKIATAAKEAEQILAACGFVRLAPPAVAKQRGIS